MMKSIHGEGYYQRVEEIEKGAASASAREKEARVDDAREAVGGERSWKQVKETGDAAS